MKVSIVIPVFGRQKIVDRCLNSVLAQTAIRDVDEIIVVDDRSAVPIAIKDNHLTRIVRIDGSGGWRSSAVAKNTGVMSASKHTDAFWFVDGDTLQEPDALESMIRTAIDMSIVGYEHCLVTLYQVYMQSPDDTLDAARSRGELFDEECTKSVPRRTHASALMSKPTYEMLGGYDEEFRGWGFVDRDMTLRAEANNVCVTSQVRGVKSGRRVYCIEQYDADRQRRVLGSNEAFSEMERKYGMPYSEDGVPLAELLRRAR